jgi:hypothetical protein
MRFVASNGRMTMNNELERIRKGVIVACFKILSKNMTGRTEENHEISHSG